MKTIIAEQKRIKKRPSLSPFTIAVFLEVFQARTACRFQKSAAKIFCEIMKKQIQEAETKKTLLNILECFGIFREFTSFQERMGQVMNLLPEKDEKKSEKLLTILEKSALKKLEKIKE